MHLWKPHNQLLAINTLEVEWMRLDDEFDMEGIKESEESRMTLRFGVWVIQWFMVLITELWRLGEKRSGD